MALDPPLLMEQVGLPPDGWQQSLLRSDARQILLLCGRQMGKSTATAALAVHEALFSTDSLILVLSPSQRQSDELFLKIVWFYEQLGKPISAEQASATSLILANRSRIVSLPGSPSTVRGFSKVKLLMVDEAALCPDALFVAIKPMLAISRGRLVCMTTPMGKRGYFHEQWTNEAADWHRIKATAAACPRIDRAFLDGERISLGERWYRQEYECSFEDTMDQFYSTDAVLRAFDCSEPALFGA